MEHPADEMLEHCRAMLAMLHGGGMEAMPHSNRMMDGVMTMGAGMLLLGLLAITLLVAIGASIAWLLLRRRADGDPDEARRALDLRYAQGQVDRDLYVRMRADLTEDAAHGA